MTTINSENIGLLLGIIYLLFVFFKWLYNYRPAVIGLIIAPALSIAMWIGGILLFFSRI